MAKKLSEQRARQVARELLTFRGWDVKSVTSQGLLLEESEYKNHKSTETLFKGKSKKGKGDGIPDFLLVNNFEGLKPVLLIETKASLKQSEDAINEAIHYGEACIEKGHEVLVVGIAGAEKEICSVIVRRKIGTVWKNLTINGRPIDWIPSPEQTQRILADKQKTEIEPERPSEQILQDQANKLNEILRECKIKDEYRPVYAATFMLALWQGEVSIDSDVVLHQINANAQLALNKANKRALAESLRVDVENDALAAKAWEIVDILKKLNIRSFLHEHDYLGQLYETFFRYTGGNTIGQYFTPRHIIEFICEILNITPNDTVFDPACGTGGFLIGALNKMVKQKKLPYEEAVDLVKSNLFGIESEPSTAALCITNMIFRGDGKSGIIKANCFVKKDFPTKDVDFVLMNPPFPHKKTDTPASEFIDRGLKSLKKRGILASIVPYSLLVRANDWHSKILKENTIHLIVTLPADLFNPYASYNTAILMIQKGIPHGNKKTFVCRIPNDGFKLKKNNRIKQSGSLLPLILEAFESKKEIPELCKMALINENSAEWSPEAYLDNAIYTDSDFISGFEEHIRKQASFYVLNGAKLLKKSLSTEKLDLSGILYSPTSKLSLEGIGFGAMNIEQYLDVVLGGTEEIEDLEEGNFPIVSTSEFFNGVTTWKNPKTFYSPPCITVATDGSTCSTFVQEYPFYAFYKVAILNPKKGVKIDVDALYYLAYLISREKWRYVYARKFGKARINLTNIIVPIKKDGTPDFVKMAELTRKANAFPLIKFFRENYKKQ
ncbi:N-6 DNA methylase [Chitinophaga niastensis]|uniref:site-specific DNA-methyltransferase (adenine-specific) n=1 Tax=Chitinophaga niastensis TaxID=536980 RepID=A0A2P8HVQ7_CHINA|nr:N-6 DNA methylase [Chitinophaga niastensis]PSL50323.1 N-6 DNA methylase [Chitinophaga niastensis]